MAIYLIRHTTPNIEKGVCYGQTDMGVTNTFTEELKSIKDKLFDVIPDKVYSSPMKRCKVLAEAFSEDIIFDNRLKELHFGDWEQKKWEDIPKAELDPWMEDFVNTPTKDGESYIDLQQRVLSFFNDLAEKEWATTVFVVTHAGVIRSLLTSVSKTDLKDSFAITLNYGEVVVCDRTLSHYSIL